MGRLHRISATEGIAGVVGTVAVALICLRLGLGVDVVKKAAGIPESAEGMGKFANGARALVLPALVGVACITPLVLIGGAGAFLLGNRRGLPWMAGALGVLLFMGSVTAIVE